MTEDNSKNDLLNPLPISKDTGDALFKPAATSIGEASKTLLDGVFHLAFDPIRKFNIQRESDLERFRLEIQASAQAIPNEFYDNSKIGLVLKSIEDSKYQLNNDEIRAMFTRLIITAMDSRSNSNISPKYSSIVSEMTPEEARLLKEIYSNTASLVPFASLKMENKDGSSRDLDQYFLLFDNYSDNNKMLELSLLESSNLINFHKDTKLVHPHFTNIITSFRKSFPENLNTLFPNFSDEEVIFEHSYYSLTTLGESFCKIVFSGR